ncbi:hypothetical protein O6H91_15G059600 [Diphasiastrum complanatum]|uniref:Uncharacterized protein n=1 Tax=Diphasiastrum complanatum TaxID=34168 RepID=A0ACC2BIN5_DIPCM|nr:hypothetical protein O6H91_15G059600 [Diphasiastrum complanatum]
MAKVVDIAYKSVTAALGLATIIFGANLTINIYRGISWHYAQKEHKDPPAESQH